jgi:hypothetical protein
VHGELASSASISGSLVAILARRRSVCARAYSRLSESQSNIPPEHLKLAASSRRRMYSDVVESTICMSIARASGAPIASAKALAVVATISPIRLRPSSRDVDAADADVPRSPFARARVATRVVRRFVARAFARVVVVVVVLIVVVLIIIIIVAECRSFDRSIDPIDRSARPRRRSRTRQTAARATGERDARRRARTDDETRARRDATPSTRARDATRRDAETRRKRGNGGGLHSIEFKRGTEG